MCHNNNGGNISREIFFFANWYNSEIFMENTFVDCSLVSQVVHHVFMETNIL